MDTFNEDDGPRRSGGPKTKDELMELESAPKSRLQIIIDRLICFLPIAAGGLALLEYYMVPNMKGNTSTDVYAYFIAILMAAIAVFFAASLFSRKLFYKLRIKAPFYTVVFLMLIAYDLLTLKSGKLMLPYFPWVDQVLSAFISDRAYMFECTVNSLILLFTGYFSGAAAGLVTGVACGYNKKINYWISPFMKLLGAIPSTTWIPVVMVLASSLFKGSVFIIALGVWFSVTIASQTGISNIDRSYFEAARTLGAKGWQLVFRIAIPFVMPNIFQGLTQGMSSACTALMVAEMIGVESGLGWYITWQKSCLQKNAQPFNLWAARFLYVLILKSASVQPAGVCRQSSFPRK